MSGWWTFRIFFLFFFLLGGGERGALKTHTPQILGVKISPPKFRKRPSKNTVKQMIFEDSPLKFGGRIVTPQMWGLWVFRESERPGRAGGGGGDDFSWTIPGVRGSPRRVGAGGRGVSGNRKWWRQTGSRQSTPLSTIRTQYEIQYRPWKRHGPAKPSRILSKREADTEFQYRPHIVDTDTIADAIFGRHFRESDSQGV